MCYQIDEVYSACKCLYYKHTVDRCVSYGRKGHYIEKRTIYVGFSCQRHLDEYYGITQLPSINPGVPVANEENKDNHDGSKRKNKNKKKKKNIEKSNPFAQQGSLESVTGQDSGPLGNSHAAIAAQASEPDSVSLFSSAITGTTITIPDPDIAENLFHDFLYYGNLRYLWPQVVRIAGSEATLVLKRFIQRFGGDLVTKASTRRDKMMGRLIQSHAGDVAKRIEEAHYRPVACPEEENLPHAQLKEDIHDENMEEIKPSAPEVLEPVDYRLVHDFVFEGGPDWQLEEQPVTLLEKNIRQWVLQAQPKMSRRTTPLQSLRNLYDASVNLCLRSATVSGMPSVSTLRHRCACGYIVSDEYIELKEGALQKLKSQLEGYGELWNASQNPGANIPFPTQGSISTAGNYLSSFWKMVSHRRNRSLANLPSQQTRPKSAEQFGCQPSPQSVGGHHNYLLVCLPFMKWATKLRQNEICRINSDRDFFLLLRSCYKEARQSKSIWPWTRRITAVDFARFEVFHGDLVNVQRKPSLPTDQYLQQYEFDSLGDDTMPPIGANLMMHYFEHPDHADVVPTLLRRVPKKLREKLHPCPIKRSSVGWGIDLVEGPDVFLTFCFGLCAFAIALAVAIAWSIARDDVQGGFAISAFVLGLLLFIGNSGRAMT